MNLVFENKDSDKRFCEALYESKVVQNWLVNRLTAYQPVDAKQHTLEIGLDPWVKTEKPSFVWAIYSVKTDIHGNPKSGGEYDSIINGGLIYRGKNEDGNDTYSSHT